MELQTENAVASNSNSINSDDSEGRISKSSHKDSHQGQGSGSRQHMNYGTAGGPHSDSVSDSEHSKQVLSASHPSGFLFGFTKRQLLFLTLFGTANFFRAVMILIAGPFYPPLAEERGIGNTAIGFVFGSYDFSTFCVVVLFGKIIIPKFGPRLVFTASTVGLGVSTVLFGCLEFINQHQWFLAHSFVIRIIAGAVDGGFYPSAFTIIALEFPEMVATAFSIFELCFGIGAIVGPVVCGALIDSLGFQAIYAIVGACLLLSALLIHFKAPKNKLTQSDAQSHSGSTSQIISPRSDGPSPTQPPSGLLALLKIPAVTLSYYNLFTMAVSIGFITATLESHLDVFNFSSLQTGAVFIVSNTIYTASAPVWGKATDFFSTWKNLIMIAGAVLVVAGFSFLGPLPFLAADTLFWTTIVGLVLHGIGIGAAIISTFSYASEAAISNGFSSTTETYGLVSSMFTCTFCLGNFVGPSVAGVLYDAVGFRWASLFVIGLCLQSVLGFTILTARQLSGDKNLVKSEVNPGEPVTA